MNYSLEEASPQAALLVEEGHSLQLNWAGLAKLDWIEMK